MRGDMIHINPSGWLTTELSTRARDYVSAAKSENTRRMYTSAWAEFEAFCKAHGGMTLPAQPQMLVDYLTQLADAGQRVSTIQLKLSAISFAHETAKAANPVKDESVRLLMQGIRRKLGTAAQQKAPIVRADLVRMVEAVPEGPRGLRDRVILLLGFAGAFRRSELVSLDVEDVRFGTREMIVTLRRSKTDQEGQGTKKHIPQLKDEALCPVRALRAWLNAASIESGPLFRSVDRWGHVRGNRLDDKAVVLVVKECAKHAGLEPIQFAGHSLRAGFVTQAASDDTPEWAIQQVTGHKSQTILRRYIRDAGLGQVQAIRRAFGESSPKV